ncbi:MAG TPA: peptidase C14 [Candidatus Moranbacteria bacterium]|nr:peptidase C14 [Candidatus Moranbacteria bacterium]HBT45836.1 peptidase C14 [Candidatus Moranbacteria bacterium]
MKKALIVGINNYPISPLSGCVNDASAISSIIETNGDGSPNFSVALKTDTQSKSVLMESIVELFNGDCETVLFYFSGHGFLNSLGGFIVTPDYKKYDEGISMDQILQLANNSKAKNKIIILDCCHSGSFGSPAISNGTTCQINEGVTILTASRGDELAMEINGHGVFTNLLLDALRGGASDLGGHITPGSVYAYIDQALGPWSQRPVFKTNVTSFTSLRKINPPIDTDILRKITEYFPEQNHEYKLDPTYEFDNKDIAIEDNVKIFKDLQKLEGVGLVVPVNEDHMYYAAINSGSCKLTALGAHYWRLAKDKLI